MGFLDGIKERWKRERQLKKIEEEAYYEEAKKQAKKKGKERAKKKPESEGFDLGI